MDIVWQEGRPQASAWALADGPMFGSSRFRSLRLAPARSQLCSLARCRSQDPIGSRGWTLLGLIVSDRS